MVKFTVENVNSREKDDSSAGPFDTERNQEHGHSNRNRGGTHTEQIDNIGAGVQAQARSPENTGGLFRNLSGFVVPPPILAPSLHHYRGPPKDQALYTSVNAAGWWYRTAAELASMPAKKRSQSSHIGRIMELPGFGHLRLGNTRCQTCQQGGHECWYTDLVSSSSHRKHSLEITFPRELNHRI